MTELSFNASSIFNGSSVFIFSEWKSFFAKLEFAESLFIWVLSIIEVPFMLLTLCAMCFLIKSQRAASVFVIQLILSDLIQVICLFSKTIRWTIELCNAYEYSLIVSVYFMACIAFERYLLVSHAIWYRTHNSLKSSCLISVIIWVVPLIFITITTYSVYFSYLSLCIALLIPFPIIILCFVGTWRGLSHSISITSHKRKLILGSLFLVLLNYTCIILPSVITIFLRYIDVIKLWMGSTNHRVFKFLLCLWYLNPLVDCILYLFMRSDAGDIMKSFFDRHQNSTQHTSSTNTEHHNVQ